MVKTADFVEHIQDLIADSRKVGKAIKAIIEYLKGNKGYSDLKTEAIMLSHDYQKNDKAFVNGTDDDKIHRTRIIQGLLKLLEEIESEGDTNIPFEKCQKLHELIGFPSSQVLETFASPSIGQVIPFTPIPTESEKSELEKLFLVKSQDLQKINFNSSKKEILTALEERKRFNEENEISFNEKIDLPNFKKGFIHFLFEDIYAAETLKDVHINDIHKVRGNNEKFEWHHQVVVISALTLSLIHSPKFDVKKVNILIDFLAVEEENVWKRALVGLVLALNYNTNRWFYEKELKNKLTALQNEQKIQKACRVIDFILTYQLHHSVNVPKGIFTQPFFTETPMHCFLPFYPENEILKENIQAADADFEGENFSNYVNYLPLADSYKYLLCLGIKDKTTQKGKMREDEANAFWQSMYLANEFSPYLNIVADYYNFYANYPENPHKDVFEKKLCINQTSLKEIILSKVTRCIVEAEQAMNKEKNIKGAILSLEQALKIERENIAALRMIVKCYETERKWKEAINYRLRIENIRSDDYENISRIGQCYANLEDYKTAFVYFERAKSMEPDDVDNLIRII
ncbi:MAG: hypothetical protein ACKVTZ_21880, partial [Bacteroidia bacterium]